MSDEEDYLSEESYEFEFEDEDDSGSDEVERNDLGMENKYYNAKGLKDDDITKAIEEFKEITRILIDKNTLIWKLRALKQLVKINFSLDHFDDTLNCLKQLVSMESQPDLESIDGFLGKILNRVAVSDNFEFVNDLYNVILDFINDLQHENKNMDRIWLRIKINKLYALLESNQIDGVPALIGEVNHKLDEVSETTSNSLRLEVIAAEMLYNSSSNHFNLKELTTLYRKSLSASTAVSHPKFLGIVRECGAKIYFYRGNYEKARIDFYESFKNYDAAGSVSKRKILKYLVLCSLVTENEVNPFQSQETQTYSLLPEYSNLLTLIKAYDRLDIDALSLSIGRINTQDVTLLKDEIFQRASKIILKNLKAKTLIQILRAYLSVSFEYIRNRLNISQSEFEDTIYFLVNQGDLWNIKLDFVNEIMETLNNSTGLIPPGLSPKDIYQNLITLGCLNYHADKNEQSTDNTNEGEQSQGQSEFFSLRGEPASNVGAFDYFSQEDVASQRRFESEKRNYVSDWFVVVNNWLNCLLSAFPAKVRFKMSQKDQIFSEKRAENLQHSAISTSRTENNGVLDFNSYLGVIPSSGTTGENELSSEETLSTTFEKISALKKWVDELEYRRDKNEIRSPGQGLKLNDVMRSM